VVNPGAGVGGARLVLYHLDTAYAFVTVPILLL